MATAYAKQNQLLKDNIRYLGRVLGQAILQKEGQETYDLIENIRKSAVKFHRENDQQASLLLDQYLKQLSPVQTVCVVRAFSYFKHLVNIAEDLYTQQITRLNEDNLAPGMLAHSVDKISAHELPFETIDAFFKDALVSPVLTAHPTEVQRKSVLDIEHTIASLLAERGNLLSKKELERNHLLIEGAICSLWQTRILRFPN